MVGCLIDLIAVAVLGTVIVFVCERELTLEVLKHAKQLDMLNGQFLFVTFFLAYCK